MSEFRPESADTHPESADTHPESADTRPDTEDSGPGLVDSRPGAAIPWLALAWALSIGLLLWVFWPGLHGPFLFDDFPNLLLSPAMLDFLGGRSSLLQLLGSGHAGPLGRPLAVITLALQAQVAGFVPYPFKLFNLAVHLCNVGLVYLLAVQLLRASDASRTRLQPARSPPPTPLSKPPLLQSGLDQTSMVALDPRLWGLLAALAWGVHPLEFTPVLYVVQRMTSLSALGTLCALLAAAQGYAACRRGQPAVLWLFVAVPLALLFSLLCKETGALLPAWLGVLGLTLWPAAQVGDARCRRVWQGFMALFCGLPCLLVLGSLPWLIPHLAAGYGSRNFDLVQRLWTEARVVMVYLRLLLLPDLQLLGLYHDDLPVSTGWLAPWTTLACALALPGFALTAVLLRRVLPWLAFAIGFFLVSQLIESTAVALELMHEHRMYLGSLGAILAAAALLRQYAARSAAFAPRVLLAAALPVLLWAGLSHLRAQDWSDPLRLVSTELRHHPNSPSAAFDVAQIYGDLAEKTADPVERARLFEQARLAALHASQVAPLDIKPRVAMLIVCALSRCTVPADTWPMLRQGLVQDHRTESMAADLLTLTACLHDPVCQLPADELRASIRVLAGNPHLTPLAVELLARAEQVSAPAGRVPAPVQRAPASAQQASSAVAQAFAPAVHAPAAAAIAR